MSATVEPANYVLPFSDSNGGEAHADYVGNAGGNPIVFEGQLPGSMGGSAGIEGEPGTIWSAYEVSGSSSDSGSETHGPGAGDPVGVLPPILDTAPVTAIVGTIIDTVDHTISPIIDTATQTISSTLNGTVALLDQTVGTLTTTLSGALGGEGLPLSNLAGTVLQDTGVLVHNSLATVEQVASPIIATAEHLPSVIFTSATEIVDQVGGALGAHWAVPTAINLVANIVDDGGHAAPLHAIASAVGSAEAGAPEPLASPLDQIIHPVSDLAHVPDAVLGAIGASTGGSLTFSADASGSAGLGNGTAVYTQYNIAVQHGSSDATHVATADTGSITNIISDAIGIGHTSIENHDTAQDHQNDVAHLLPQHSEIGSHHGHGLFG